MQIKDVNDNVPRFEFEDSDPQVTIPESAEIGYVIPFSIPVFDDDVDERNNKVQLSVKDSELFAFNEKNELVVNGVLDYEAKKEHQITIVAKNPGASDDIEVSYITSIIKPVFRGFKAKNQVSKARSGLKSPGTVSQLAVGPVSNSF